MSINCHNCGETVHHDATEPVCLVCIEDIAKLRAELAAAKVKLRRAESDLAALQQRVQEAAALVGEL